MKPSLSCAAIAFLTIAATLHAGPTPVPKALKAKGTAQVQKHAPSPAGATAIFLAQLRADGRVQKVLVLKSTGNSVVDAQVVAGLSVMRFPDEILTQAERAKRQKVLPFTISAEELKK